MTKTLDEIADLLDRWAEKHGDDVRAHMLEPDDVYRAGAALRVKAQLVEALEEMQQNACEAYCLKHEELSTSHRPACDDARAALKAAKETP